MRGKAEESHQAFLPCGITPAYAGKSLSIDNFFLCFKDHPRLCGEKSTNREGGAPTKGSPPPMRGKAVIDYATSVIWGITPAYAGKRP